MKRIITYGTFDLLHYGHINLLRRAKAVGDYLIVALSTDEFNWNQKQKKCYFCYEKRKQLLEAIRYVDLVIPEENWEQKKTDVKEYHIDTFVMGDDNARSSIWDALQRSVQHKSKKIWRKIHDRSRTPYPRWIIFRRLF